MHIDNRPPAATDGAMAFTSRHSDSNHRRLLCASQHGGCWCTCATAHVVQHRRQHQTPEASIAIQSSTYAGTPVERHEGTRTDRETDREREEASTQASHRHGHRSTSNQQNSHLLAGWLAGSLARLRFQTDWPPEWRWRRQSTDKYEGTDAQERTRTRKRASERATTQRTANSKQQANARAKERRPKTKDQRTTTTTTNDDDDDERRRTTTTTTTTDDERRTTNDDRSARKHRQRTNERTNEQTNERQYFITSWRVCQHIKRGSSVRRSFVRSFVGFRSFVFVRSIVRWFADQRRAATTAPHRTASVLRQKNGQTTRRLHDDDADSDHQRWTQLRLTANC